jgi:hypothetical protein
MGRLDKLKREMLMEANKRLLNEQPVDVGLNIFCKNNKRNSSFRENGLTYHDEIDMPKGIKRLLLTRSVSGVMDHVASDAGNPGQFMLDVIPTESLGDRFSDEFDVSTSGFLLVSYSGPMRAPYSCIIEAGTDKYWENYFNNL